MNRKQFLALLAAGGLAGALPVGRAGAADPKALPYRKLATPAPTDAEAGKIEVVEFFWFGCPHCYTLEPLIARWSKTLAPDVVFRRQHVPFRERKHQQVFFTLQAIGQESEKVLGAVFNAIHADRKKMLEPAEVIQVLAPLGVDAKQFQDAWASFGVRTKMQRADKLADAYGLDGVPALGVNGRYLTAPSLAGSNEGALDVVNQLIAEERKARR
jgi:protein dithiol oxidoreductase (disulfide-forming)